MALLREHRIFTPRFVAGLLTRGAAGVNATVRIFTRTLVDSGLQVTATEHTEYDGLARVQPINQGSFRQTPGSQALIRQVRVSLPLNPALLLFPGTAITVTGCDLLPALVGWSGTLRDVMDAPNAIEMTLLAEVDTATLLSGGST